MSDAMCAASRSRRNEELAAKVSELEIEFLVNPSQENFLKFSESAEKAEKETRSGMWGDPGLKGIINLKEIYANDVGNVSSDTIANYVSRKFKKWLTIYDNVPIIYTLADLASRRNGADVDKIQDNIKSIITLKHYEEIKAKMRDGKFTGKDVEKIMGNYFAFPIKPLSLNNLKE